MKIEYKKKIEKIYNALSSFLKRNEEEYIIPQISYEKFLNIFRPQESELLTVKDTSSLIGQNVYGNQTIRPGDGLYIAAVIEKIDKNNQDIFINVYLLTEANFIEFYKEHVYLYSSADNRTPVFVPNRLYKVYTKLKASAVKAK